jgi:hypothetical protein
MAAYHVSYDLLQLGQAYHNLILEIKRSPGYLSKLQSHWIVVTNETLEQLNARLSAKIDRNDRLSISLAFRPMSGRLEKDKWDWITRNVPELPVYARS